MALYNNDLQPSGRICPVLSVTGVSGVSQTVKLGGGDYTISIFTTSGSAGFSGATITVKATPDETLIAPFELRSASGPLTATSNVHHSFTLPKGYTLRCDASSGDALTDVSIWLANARPTSTEGV